MADYELNAVKLNPSDGGKPLVLNLGFWEHEENLRVMRETINDLEAAGWQTKVLRSTMLPWDVTES